ncbi:MAG: TraR/DksA C4-type zinc finger protein [Steroidobacteraceae bacterium]
MARRQLLIERHERVHSDLARQNDPLVADSSDQAIQRENDEALEIIDDAAMTEVAAIDAALQRFDRGLYGVCNQCGAKIEMRRLAAVPHAITCVRCVSR